MLRISLWGINFTYFFYHCSEISVLFPHLTIYPQLRQNLSFWRSLCNTFAGLRRRNIHVRGSVAAYCWELFLHLLISSSNKEISSRKERKELTYLDFFLYTDFIGWFRRNHNWAKKTPTRLDPWEIRDWRLAYWFLSIYNESAFPYFLFFFPFSFPVLCFFYF